MKFHSKYGKLKEYYPYFIFLEEESNLNPRSRAVISPILIFLNKGFILFFLLNEINFLLLLYQTFSTTLNLLYLAVKELLEFLVAFIDFKFSFIFTGVFCS